MEEFPPIVCRLLAREHAPGHPVRPLTNTEIAERSGLSLKDVAFISSLLTWDDLPLRIVRKFSEACGIYLTDREDYRTHRAYIVRDPSWRYLKQSPEWDTFFKPLIIAYVQHQRNPAAE